MTDIFRRSDLWQLLRGKKVVFMGDSNIRSYYKDILCLNHKDEIIGQQTLKDKMESTLFGDRLMTNGERTNGRHYREERRLEAGQMDISFYFMTRVYNDYVQDILRRITSRKQPDVIIINSCVWDMARYGPYGVEEYRENLVRLMKNLQRYVTPDCLIIWATAPPIGQKPQGGFLLVQLEFLKFCLRFHVMEANTYAQKVVVANGFDVVDIHYHLRMQLQNRCKDGIHWEPVTVRYITNLLLTHIAVAWGVRLPNRFQSEVTEKALENQDPEERASNKENDPISVQKSSKVESEKRKGLKSVVGSYHDFAKRERLDDYHRRKREQDRGSHRYRLH